MGESGVVRMGIGGEYRILAIMVEVVLRYDDLGNMREGTRFWGKKRKSAYE
jgi:hypothetical protein